MISNLQKHHKVNIAELLLSGHISQLAMVQNQIV